MVTASEVREDEYYHVWHSCHQDHVDAGWLSPEQVEARLAEERKRIVSQRFEYNANPIRAAWALLDKLHKIGHIPIGGESPGNLEDIWETKANLGRYIDQLKGGEG